MATLQNGDTRITTERMHRPACRWRRVPGAILLAGVLLHLAACGDPPPIAETIITTSELRVATVNGPAAYFEARDEDRGVGEADGQRQKRRCNP